MIEVDNSVGIEEKVLILFEQSINVSHTYYKTIDMKMCLLAEFYIYTQFLYNLINTKTIDLKLHKRPILYNHVDESKALEKLSVILNTFNLIYDKDFDYISETLTLISNVTSYSRIQLNKDIRAKYTSMQYSILRKMKIKMILK